MLTSMAAGPEDGSTPNRAVNDATHTVSVRLGEVLNYNAQLYVYLIGSRGETSRVPLKPDGPLERDKFYKFPLALTVDIGTIEKIVLGQNSRGYGQGVFVDEVDVQPTNQPPVHFPCQCWLAEDVWDSCTERELEPGVPVEKPSNTTYELEFKTGDQPGAGTDANVTLQIFGAKGQTEKIMLRQEGRTRTLQRFDRGRTDKFDVQTMDVGEVYKVRISHDNTNPDPAWFLEKLTIYVEDQDQKYIFPVNNWITITENDTRATVDMEPIFEEPIARIEREVPVMAEYPYLSQQMVLYTVSFRLGPLKDPFTEIFLILHGESGDSEKIPLKSAHGNRLVSGKNYKVITEIPDIGQIKGATVGHDSVGPNKGVFVEEIDVSAPAERPTQFPCRCWLAEDEDDGQTVRKLRPGETLTYPYEILFKLGEVLNPNAKLFMVIYGTKGDSGKLYLSPSDGSKFAKGRKYKVIADVRDIGDVDHVRLSQEGPGRGVFLEEVEVRAKDKDPVIFPCQCWLDDSEGDAQKSRVLRPGESFTKPYLIRFRLGKVLDPDAKLYMVIHGTQGDSDKLYLTPLDGSKFAPGGTYEVVAHVPDIGDIDEIELGQEGPGRGVFVEEVEVYPQDKDPVIFPCRCWLDDSHGDGQKSRVLRPGDALTSPYEIIFRLGEVYNPRAKLYMIIHGTEDDSEKLYLTPEDGRPFVKGQTYRVVADIGDIGDIKTVELGQEGPGRGVFVEEVEVRAKGKDPVIFPCQCWLDESEGDGQTTRVLTPNEPVAPMQEDILYNATFETGDIPFAGTDANVFLQMTGEEGTTGKIEFGQDDGAPTRFGKGRIDKFAVETIDVGKLTSVRVGHDNTGRSPKWFLKQLMIDIPCRDEHYVFPFNDWITGDEVDLQPERAEVYTILMKLGEVLDPHAPVHIQLLGDEGESGKIQVKPGVRPTDKFEPGKVYKLMAKVNNIGPIRAVRVGQDENGPSKGLFVEEVEVTSSQGERVVFPVNCWTVPIQDVTYDVMFKTGSQPDAGTSANVFFQLHGDKESTEEILLKDENANLFARSGMDKFKVETRDVGKIESLRVGHDNAGPSPEWYLEQVCIDTKDERSVFNVNQWIGGRNPTVVKVRPEPYEKLPDLDYRVTIKTGDEPEAGTDANVFLTMYGERGPSAKFLLKDNEDRNQFSRGRTDKFAIRAKDLGKLTRIRVSRDNAGVRPGWLLDKVVIDIPAKMEQYVFTCRKWLLQSDPDAILELDPEPSKENVYTVVAKIGEVRDPGVSPYFVVGGDKDETGKIMLRDGYKQSHVFMTDHTYRISLKCPDVGKIDKIRLGDDGGGKGRTMYVEEVTVLDNFGNETVFPCRCWLGMDENNMVIVRELLPGQPAPDDVEEVYYHLTILTADKPNAGTESKVYFRLYGDKGETSDIILADERFKRFERGRADKFVVQTADVGKLNRMVIGHNNTGVDPPWLLEEVHVDIPSRNEHYVFKCGRWLAVVNGKDETETVLYPGGDKGPVEEMPIMEEVQNEAESARPIQGTLNTDFGDMELEDTDYELEFKTADEPGAGTDCSVYCQMIGDNGDTREIDLGENKDAMHFQQGQTDRFRIQAKDVGKLRTFRVGHDNRGSRPRWLLDEIVVYHIARKERYVFKNNRWIGGPDPTPIDIPLDSWTYCQLESQMPDIPDLLDYMQSGNVDKMIHAGFYLQHLCYNDDDVKNKVRILGGIPIVVRCLSHQNDQVRFAAACVLRNLSSGTKSDQNKLEIADCDGIEKLIEMLQRSDKPEHRSAVLVVLRNLSILVTLRLRILRLCLHMLVIIIIKTYSGWDRNVAQRDPPKMDGQWSELLRHATRIVRNLSSAGLQAREDMRNEEYLIDCLVWIIRTSVKNKNWNDECVENCVCTMRNLSYRLESELDRDIHTDDEVQLDKAVVKEQQSQGCFAGCGGGKSKKKKKNAKNSDMSPMTNKGPAQGAALLYQGTTVQQYFILLKNAKNNETLEGSAGALHNLTACSWKWAIKIRGDTRREQVIPNVISLLRIDYDPTIRASAILLRNLSVDRENKRIIGEKGTGPLVNRLPTGEPREPRVINDATIVSIMCALYQLGQKSEKNAKILRKTTGIRRMVRIAKSQERYDDRVVRTANQTLASLSANEGLKEQMKNEDWDVSNAQNHDLSEFPDELDKISAPGTPSGSNRSWRNQSPQVDRDPELYKIERQGEFYQRSPTAGSAGRASLDRMPPPSSRSGRGSTSGSQHGSEASDKPQSWRSSLNQLPPPYTSDDSLRGSRDVYEMKDRKPNGPPVASPGKKRVPDQDDPNDLV
ncbi:lipoxygenase homology domain-containing protein 1 isoform X2 [Nematostella vectensis]|uniref:lipoxygenase homology domain-containing protein 1 isoform X2 n=1 Tax=Nematostella vectensis TaxID=45351 RepID=UPI0020779B00|nr:lipoxygenase homology domain-containing protein 1 isoform X2 [Nematostella vectensis]